MGRGGARARDQKEHQGACCASLSSPEGGQFGEGVDTLVAARQAIEGLICTNQRPVPDRDGGAAALALVAVWASMGCWGVEPSGRGRHVTPAGRRKGSLVGRQSFVKGVRGSCCTGFLS